MIQGDFPILDMSVVHMDMTSRQLTVTQSLIHESCGVCVFFVLLNGIGKFPVFGEMCTSSQLLFPCMGAVVVASWANLTRNILETKSFAKGDDFI